MTGTTNLLKTTIKKQQIALATKNARIRHLEKQLTYIKNRIEDVLESPNATKKRTRAPTTKERVEKMKKQTITKKILDETLDYGTYKIGKYKIKVMRKEPLTPTERVKKYYENNPEAKEERNKQRREQYKKRKKEGTCTKCGKRKALKNKIFCTKCRKKNLERQRKK
jgi:hypothetical protein